MLNSSRAFLEKSDSSMNRLVCVYGTLLQVKSLNLVRSCEEAPYFDEICIFHGHWGCG